MVTSLVLLDWLTAFLGRTVLRISNHPIDILRIGTILDLPFFSNGASTRFMRVSATFKAVEMSTTAQDLSPREVSRFNSVDTAWLRTPSNTLIVISEGFAMKLLVKREIFLFFF